MDMATSVSALLRRSCYVTSSLGIVRRSLSSQSNATASLLDHPHVLVQCRANSRTAILNRPSTLNALNTSMGSRLQKLYQSWEQNPDIGFVALKGMGRAFCAGGDIVGLRQLIHRGDVEAIKDLFRTVYSFIHLVGTYLKPHVALLNGITMGGGAGISIPGTFRVATDKTIFATPETLIGFHPDGGASFHLSHLTGHLGEYLALTGAKLNGAEMSACGLATHYSLHAKLPLIEEQIGKLVTDDPSVVEASLNEHSDLVHPDNMSIIQRTETIDRCFGHDTVEEIIDSLENEAARTRDPWCIATLNRLDDASPLSLKVALRSIRQGRLQTLGECLVREYRMSLQGISKQITNDFSEGVRARMVDKDFAPKWNPLSLEHVSKDMVDQYFAPLDENLGPELELGTRKREAFK